VRRAIEVEKYPKRMPPKAAKALKNDGEGEIRGRKGGREAYSHENTSPFALRSVCTKAIGCSNWTACHRDSRCCGAKRGEVWGRQDVDSGA
jgi:hypothetical protein